MTNPVEDKFDLFSFLKALSKKDRECYERLSEEHKKEVKPFVIARWLSGVHDMRQVYFLNEVVNKYTFTLQKHKGLLVKLMTICTSGRPTRFSYPKTAKKKSVGSSMLVTLVQRYFKYSSKDAAEVLPLLSDEDLLSYAEQLGYQKGEISALKRDLKKRAKV